MNNRMILIDPQALETIKEGVYWALHSVQRVRLEQGTGETLTEARLKDARNAIEITTDENFRSISTRKELLESKEVADAIAAGLKIQFESPKNK